MISEKSSRIDISESLIEFHTTEIRPRRLLNHPEFGDRIVVVDTPALEYTWYPAGAEKPILLSGIVYLHQITDNRHKKKLSALDVVQMARLTEKPKPSGEGGTVFVTTHWDLATDENRKNECEKRQIELETFWRGVMKVDTIKHARFNNTEEAAVQCMNLILPGYASTPIDDTPTVAQIASKGPLPVSGPPVLNALPSLQYEIGPALSPSISQLSVSPNTPLTHDLVQSPAQISPHPTTQPVRTAPVPAAADAGLLDNIPQGGGEASQNACSFNLEQARQYLQAAEEQLKGQLVQRRRSRLNEQVLKDIVMDLKATEVQLQRVYAEAIRCGLTLNPLERLGMSIARKIHRGILRRVPMNIESSARAGRGSGYSPQKITRSTLNTVPTLKPLFIQRFREAFCDTVLSVPSPWSPVSVTT
ncbi:hypothetical protein CVT24_001431 [Panaeolus cyanescens]|uniref:Uncharacterized protein n=1 Tax=Panaeolus cyanescens TaxID=181874 RepID=A0A409WIT4_9AGAR|nr:hypothetical protein CVT24_001431 [Panaeolus cyanescens]